MSQITKTKALEDSLYSMFQTAMVMDGTTKAGTDWHRFRERHAKIAPREVWANAVTRYTREMLEGCELEAAKEGLGYTEARDVEHLIELASADYLEMAIGA
jgi:uncharacterized ferritin-like protein (DUF455 family)